MSIPKLKQKLDVIFSQYIRLRNADDRGYVNCFTCGTVKHWKEGDAGHFMVRQKMPTRYNEQNVQFQCKRCNGFQGGEQYIFGRKLDALYGPGTANALVALSNQMEKWIRADYEEKIAHYKRQVEIIKRDRGLG